MKPSAGIYRGRSRTSGCRPKTAPVACFGRPDSGVAGTSRTAARFIVLLIALAHLSLAVPSAEPAEPAGRPDLIVSGATLLTLTQKGSLEGWDLLIRDGVIADMSPTRRATWPDVGQVIDGSGKFLLPGLHDMHVHVFDERDLEVYALMGVSTVRNMDGWGWHLDLRDRPAPGAWRARMATTGAQYQPPLVDSPVRAARRAAREAGRGFSWIKVYDGLGLDELNALAGATRRLGTRVTGHLPDGIPATEALATRAFADVAHAEELLEWYSGVPVDESAAHFDELARAFRAAGTALVTTLVNNRMILEQHEDLEANLARREIGLAAPMLQVFWRSRLNPHAEDSDAKALERQRWNQSALRSIVVGLHERGVRLLAGSDAPNPTTVPAHSIYTELEMLVEAGLTPAAAIRSATTLAADHLGRSRRGRIQVGAAADLLLLDADPRQDVGNLRRRAGVFLRGRYLSRSAAEAELSQLRRRYAREATLLAGFDPESAAAILRVLQAPHQGAAPSLSAEALTSAVWAYLKLGNRRAARTLAGQLIQLYPGERAESVLAATRSDAGEP